MYLCDSHIIESFKKLLKGKMSKPNLFIFPCQNNSSNHAIQFNNIVSGLKEEFTTYVCELKYKKPDLFDGDICPDNLSFKCIAVDSGKIEIIRDVIKEVLWPNNVDNKTPQSLKSLLTSSSNIQPYNFNLSEYGVFIPFKSKYPKIITTHSFNHKPVFYRYRVALDKLCRLPNFLGSYLQLLFTECPNHLFRKSNFRASARCTNITIANDYIKKESVHDLIMIAKESMSFNHFKSRHENLQKYMLLNDPCTIACEVPIWIESWELIDYKKLFKTDDVLTGHIDILRHEKDNKIGIWDYKPGAKHETDAMLQVSLYALMLSVRTGISLENITCGYFDEDDVVFVESRPLLAHCDIR